MSNASRVLWTEGLFLRPQHEQSQDAFHEQRLWSSLRSLHAYPWGLSHIAIANSGSELDQVAVTEIEALLMDGSTIVAPTQDDLPPPISLAQADPEATTLVVSLVLPAWHHDGGNCADNPQEGRRYASKDRMVPDMFGGTERAPINFARAQPRIKVSVAGAVEADALPVARLRRTPTGRFRLDEAFIAPMVNARQSAPLNSRVAALQGALRARINSLSSQQSENVKEAVAFRAGDMATFWLLQALNGASASLSHLLKLPVVAPERLFHELLKLAGDLVAFSNVAEHHDLPSYDHARCDTAFAALFKRIDALIGIVIPTRFTAVPFVEESSSHFKATLDAGLPNDGVSFYLAVSSKLPPQDVMQAVPRRFKVGAPDDVATAIVSALPCIALTYVAQPPAAVPARPGRLYFALDSRGPAFGRVRAAGEIAAFAPKGIDEVTLELLIIND